MDRTERREVRTAVELCHRQPVDRHDAPVFERNEIATAEPRETDGGIAFRRQVTIRREPERAALL